MTEPSVVVAPALVVAPVAPPAPGESMPATTTVQQDKVWEGQRHINLIWERTQQVLAISMTYAAVGACVYLIVYGTSELRLAAFTYLCTRATTIGENYFTRTNHEKTGGVGAHQTGR